jgi:nicotinamidase-related amidase
MPIDTLSHATALLVIDLQVGTTSAALAHPIDGVAANAGRLIDAFHVTGRTVVIASVTGTPAGRTTYSNGAMTFPAEFTEPISGLPTNDGDLTIERATWSVFAGTDLHERLQSLGVTDLILAGLATSFGIESTARDAYDLGYSVVIASDAVTDRSIESHDHSIGRVFPALGKVATTDEIIAAPPA